MWGLVVTAAAKKSGDFSVLSQTDMMLLALTVSMKAEHDAHKASITPVAAAPVSCLLVQSLFRSISSR